MRSIVCPPKHTKAWKHLESIVGEDKAIALYIANNEVVPYAKFDLGLRAKYYTWDQILRIKKNLKQYNSRFNSSHQLTQPEQVGQSVLYSLDLIEDWSAKVVYKNSSSFTFDASEKAEDKPDWASELSTLQKPLVITRGENQFISITGNIYPTYAEALEDRQADLSSDEPVDVKQYVKEGVDFVSNENNTQNVQYQLPQGREMEEFVASEKTIRDLAARMSDRIGIPVEFESDRSKQYKGKLENGTAVINLAYATLDTPIHEILGHPIVRAIKNKNDKKAYYEIESQTDKYVIVKNQKGGSKVFNTLQEANDFIARENTTTLYQSLLKELETGRGKEVFEQVKRDYVTKEKPYPLTSREDGSEGYGRIYTVNGKDFNSFNAAQEYQKNNPDLSEKYTLEEQQEEAIVELMSLMTAEKLDNIKDGKLISLLKRLLKEMKQFIRSLINQKEVEIDKLPDNMTLGDLSDLLAYSNSKLILPGYEVEYTTPDNEKFKTYQEASNHISELAKNVKDVDLSNVDLKDKNKVTSINEINVDNFAGVFEDFIKVNGKWYNQFTFDPNHDYSKDEVVPDNQIIAQWNARFDDVNEYSITKSGLEGFIKNNKEYEQSKEIIEEWKKINNIQYNPEEIYSRGQEFSSVVGAYSSFDVNLMMQNLLTHIEDNEKAGGKFAISAFTKPIDKQIGHLEGGGGKIKFKIYPKSEDILWAANTDVYSGSVWDASEKVNKDKKSELLGVSYTKYPSLNNIDAVQPNLASIVDDLAHHHNELGIVLTGNNFRLEYDENIPYSAKKIIDSINSILDQKYGKLVKPEIKEKTNKEVIRVELSDPHETKFSDKIFTSEQEAKEWIKKESEQQDKYYEEEDQNPIYKWEYKIVKQKQGIQPTQTNETLKESIESVSEKIGKDVYHIQLNSGLGKYVIYGSSGVRAFDENFNSEKEAQDFLDKKHPKKEYTEQALINIKIAKLKEVAKKYQRSLIRSEVRPYKSTNQKQDLFDPDELPFQLIGNNNLTLKQQLEEKLKKQQAQQLYSQYLEQNPNGSLEQFKSWVNEFNTNEYLQLASNLVNPAIEELDNFLLDFLKNFNVKSKKFEELKSRLGVNALGATDVLNKLIWYVKNRNEETLPEEASHMLVALMGENHSDIKELLNNISNWSEYKSIKNQYLPIYKDENKVKIEAVGKLIAKALVKNYKANGLDKNKLQKALDKILNFIEDILDSMNLSNIFFYNQSIADHIAINVLSGNKDYIYKIKNFNPNLNTLEEIENNSNAKKIINKFSSSNVKMTGSLAIAGTENIRRPKGQGIHDLDFKVKSFEVFNKEVLPKIPENAVPAHYGWHKKTYSTYAYLIPHQGYKIQVLERKDDFSNGWITNYKLFNEKNEQVEITQQNVMSVDFFVYKEGSNQKDFDFLSEFIPASLVYEGKMSLGGKSNPYFFSRDKDQEDYVLRNPKSFIPFEKHIYYQLDNTLSDFISQKSQERLNQIQELFNQNPDFSSQIYKALGFDNVITPTDKIVWGHPGIGKTYLRESGRTDIIDFDSDYKTKINEKFNLPKGFKARNDFQKSNKAEYQKAVRELWNKAKQEAKKTGKQLFASDMILLREFASDFDKVITMSKDTFINRAKQRNDYTEGETEKWKTSLDTEISKIDKSKVFNTDKYLSDLFITPQQKQQAQRLYSSYLQTTNNPTIEGFKQWNNGQQQINELFESNETLANQVYEALGFKSNLKTSLGKELEYKDEYVPTNRLKDFKQYQVLDEKGNDIGSVVIEYRGSKNVILHPKLKIEGKGYGKDLYKFISNKFNVEIQEWKEGAIANSSAAKKMWDSLEKEGTAKRIIDEEGDNFRVLNYRQQTTSEQKQQAQQLYSQYLDSLNKPDTNPILQTNQQEQVKKFVELHERLNNKEFIEGAKNAYENSEKLKSFGTQEQYNDYIARVSLGIIKNPSSGDYNYNSKVKDIVYHGSPSKHDVFKTIDENAREERFKHRGAMFTSDKNYVHAFGENLYSVILNIKNPKILSENVGINSAFVATQYYSVWNSESIDGVIGHDALLDLDHISEGTEYVVFEPEQIHILGSEKDIQGFKRFVGKGRTLGIPRVAQQPVEIQQKFAKAKSSFELHPSIPAKNAREIVTTMRGMMVEAIARQSLKAAQEKKKNFKPIAMKQGVLIVIPYLHKEYQKLLDIPEAERTPEQKFSIAQWEILSLPSVLPRLQRFVMLELKQLGYKFDSEGLAESPVEDSTTLAEAQEQDETVAPDQNILDVLVEGEDENQVGKGSQGNDYAGMSRSTKSTLSTLVKSWLSGIPTTTPSIIGFGQKTYKDLNQVIAVLNSLLRDKATGDEQIAALKKAASQARDREWLGTIADRLIAEKAIGSPIYNQFVDKFYQKFNQLRLVRTFFEPKGYESSEGGAKKFYPLKDKDGNFVYDLTVKVINLNREDVPKNLRDAWANNFLMQSFSVESEGRFQGRQTINSDLRTEIKNAYENFKTFASLNYRNGMWTSPLKATERLQQLFSLIGVDLNAPTLEDLTNGFVLDDDKQTFEPYTSKVKGSVFSPKSGYMAQIFEPIIQGTETTNNPFGTSGMIRVSEIMSQYIDDYVNTSVSDGKGRKLWAYGIPDPNWVEFTKIVTSATQPGLTTAEFEKTHIGQILKDKFSGRSRILNKLKDLQSAPKDLKNFVEALQIFTFNTLKGQDSNEGKELKNMVEAEHIFTKIALFTDVKEAVANSKIIQMFITTPSDKSRMECITTMKLSKGFKIDSKTKQITILDKGINTLYNYFLAEYDRIKEFQAASPEAQARFLSNENYLPELFYFFPQLNDRNYIWKPEGGKFVLRDLNEVLPNGLTVEQYVKAKLTTLAMSTIQDTKKMWQDAGLIENGRLITSVPQAYIDSEVDAYLLKKDALKSLYDQLKTNPKSAELKEKAITLEKEVQQNATEYLVADYALNYLVHNMEMHLFMLGDPAMYVKDEKSRNKALKETEKVYLDQDQLKSANLNTLIDFIRDVMTNLGKRMAGVQASRQASADSKGHITKILKIADNLLINGKRANFVSKELADKVYEDLLGEDFVSKFKDIKPGDGQGFMSAKEDLYLKYKYGKITKEVHDTILKKVEMAAEDVAAGRPIRKAAQFTKEEKFYTQPIKPVVFANKLDAVPDGDKIIYKRKVIYNKNSEFALYPQWTHDLEIDKLRVLMDNTGADRIAFLSAVKAGADNVIDGVFLQDQDGTITINDEVVDNFEQFITEGIDREYFGIQLEVPYDEGKSKIRIGTQQIKMLFDEVLDQEFNFLGKKVSGKELQALQAKIYSLMVRNKLGSLFTKLGATPLIKGSPIDPEDLKDINLEQLTFHFDNLEALSKALIEHAEAQGYSTNVLEGLKLTEDKQSFVVPMLFNGNLQKFEKLLLSMIKNVIFQKIHGKSFVLGTELGFLPKKKKTRVAEGEEGAKEIKKYEGSIVFVKPEGGKGFGESGLLGPRLKDKNNPNGEWLPGQVILPWKFKAAIENFIIETPEGKFLDTSKISPDLLRIIGIRIPTQGHPSMATIEIVGFLPKWAGDLLIAPQDFITQFGHDFDVDKMYSYIYNYVYGDTEDLDKIKDLRKESRQIFMSELEKEKSIPVEFKTALTYIIGANDFYKKKFEIPEFREYLRSNVKARPSKIQGILDYFDNLDPETIKQINRSAKTEKGRLLHIKQAEKRGKPLKDHKKIADFIPEEDLSKALAIKSVMTSYNNEHFDEIFEERFPKYDEYEAYLKEFESKKALSSERKALAEQIAALESQQRLTKIEPNVDDIDDNNQKQLENYLMDVHHAVLSHPEVIKKSLEGIGEGKIKELASRIKSFFNKDGNANYLPFSDKEKIVEFFDNAAGKIGVGIFSVANTFFSLIQEKGVYLQELDPFGKSTPRPFRVKNSDGTFVDLSHLSASTGVNRLISIFQSASVDNAKYKALYAISQNEETMGVTSIMSALYNPKATEFDEEYITYFLLQPSIQEYISALRGSKNTLLEERLTKAEAQAYYSKILERYEKQLADIYKQQGFTEEQIREEILKSLTNSGYSLESIEQDGVTSLGLRDLFEKQDTLQNDEQFIKAQIALLVDFTYLKNAADELRTIQYAINSDSKGTSVSLFEGHYKEQRFNELLKEQKIVYFSKEMVNILYNGNEDSIPNLMSQVAFLANRIFNGNSNQDPILPFLTSKVKKLFDVLMEITGRTGDQTFNQKLVKEMFNSYLSYIWTNPNFKIADTSIQQERFSLLVDSEDNKSLGTQIEEFKKSELYFANPKLHPLLTGLKIVPHKEYSDMKFVIFNASSGLVVDDEDIRVALDILHEEAYPLFESLMKYQLIMQGYQSATNMRGLIPIYYFEGFDFLSEMQRMNRNLNGYYGTNDIVDAFGSVKTSSIVPKFLEQHLQHHPERAPKMNEEYASQLTTPQFDSKGRQIGVKSDPTQYVVKFKTLGDSNTNYYKVKDDKEDYVFPYMTRYDSDLQKIRLYRLDSKTAKGYLFKELPLLGTNEVDEFDMSSSGQDVVVSMFPENNSKINVAKLGYKVLPMDPENQELIKAGIKTLTSRSSKDLEGLWKLSGGLKIQLLLVGQIAYDEKSHTIEVWKNGKQIDALSPDFYAKQEGFKNFSDLKQTILIGEGLSLTPKFLTGVQKRYLYKISVNIAGRYTPTVQEAIEADLRKKIANEVIVEKC